MSQNKRETSAIYIQGAMFVCSRRGPRLSIIFSLSILLFAACMYVWIIRYVTIASASRQPEVVPSSVLTDTNRHSNNVANEVNVVIAADFQYIQGLPPLIHSILANTRNLDNIRIHIVVCDYPVDNLLQYLECNDIRINKTLQVTQFTDSIISTNIRAAWTKIFMARRLSSVCNYARAYLHRLLPGVSKVIFIDADTLVLSPIEDLWAESKIHKTPFQAVARLSSYEKDFILRDVSPIYHKRFGTYINGSLNTFSAGLFVMDLNYYREHNLVDEVEFWLIKQTESRHPLWQLDCQSIFQLVYYNKWDRLSDIWSRFPSSVMLDNFSGIRGSIHWSGKPKPWMEFGTFSKAWKKYRPSECSGHGVCQNAENRTDWYCACNDFYHGTLCQHK
ncbi:uncharacterized protein LOC102803051 [Saccoglossus kowalevskii]|uniref:Probable galacturonosyltransferase-like 10-like n=1 Tax=Saccoglossus kowalevskii TaxID=10224 RepID=A0ABM0M2J7_SACKO|nr:PREDICTED: probable galacturonosyltransferase-like 10-like [Saccoglossus kowalevskii]